MTKKELIEAVASKTGDTIASTNKMLNALINTMTDELSKGNDVTISNLGIFKSTLRTACKGYNPKTGEDMTIPARRVVTFKVSAPLKRAINE